MPASPCIGVCHLRAGSRVCDGCLRTLDEITEWSTASVVRRRQILELVTTRRAATQKTQGAELFRRRETD